MIESVVLLQTIGGECPDDIGLLADDGCLERGLGYRPPKATALRYFPGQFHDQDRPSPFIESHKQATYTHYQGGRCYQHNR